ncbi:MAG: ECF transporter S component [Clostridiales bacterium]|nr:ECF transporter S component [Clostridiales bacterium]
MFKNTSKTVMAALCLALCLLLPFLTGQIPQIGSMISPMHIPVLLCGFICGWPYGLLVGLIAPVLRSLIFTMPPMITAIVMAFELGAYGALTGLFYSFFKKRSINFNMNVIISLVLSMLLGRIVWGIAAAIIYTATGSEFTFAAFIAGGFLNAVPAIIIHIILIPVIVIALKRAGIIENE